MKNVHFSHFVKHICVAGMLAGLIGCTSGDSLLVDKSQFVPGALVDPNQALDHASLQFSIEGRALTVTLRTDADMAPPTGITIHFPAALFDGFLDNGVKSVFGIAGLYTESLIRGAPLLIQSNAQALFNLPRAASLSVTSGTLTVTPTGSPLPVIPAGVYTMNFLPGVFNLNPGAHEIQVNLNFAGGVTQTLTKLLMIQSRVIPHLGAGQLGSILLNSRLVINNPGKDAISVKGRFFTQQGSPFNLTIGNSTSDQHQFEVPAGGTLQATLEAGTGESLALGWALLTADSGEPFQAAVVFTTAHTGASSQVAEPLKSISASSISAQAGIGAAALDTHHVLRVTQRSDGLNTAFAVVNPTSATATIKLTLKDDTGTTFQADPLELGPKNQTAKFLSELFNLPPNQDISGTLALTSNVDIGVISLQTLNLEATASLPSGTPGN